MAARVNPGHNPGLTIRLTIRWSPIREAPQRDVIGYVCLSRLLVHGAGQQRAARVVNRRRPRSFNGAGEEV
jgi:hypothetical protein